jgi:hypothetical protein
VTVKSLKDRRSCLNCSSQQGLGNRRELTFDILAPNLDPGISRYITVSCIEFLDEILKLLSLLGRVIFYVTNVEE